MTKEIFALNTDHFNEMVEAALVGIYIIQDDLLRYVNPALARMFGYHPKELIDRVNVLDLIHPEDREGVRSRMRQRFTGESAATPHVARGITAAGEVIHFESLARFVIYQGRPAITGTLVNVTNCVQAQDKLEKHRQQLKRLSAQLIASREAESKRISQELHDEIGQALTAVSINLAQIKQNLPQDVPAAVHKRLAESEALIAQTLILTRKISLELRPTMLDDLGLIPTLRWYIHQFGDRLNIEAAFTTNGIRQSFSPELETVVYRVVQEGLTNIARHAQASKIEVNLDYQAGRLLLTITDNGIGFDVQELLQSKNVDHRLGLLGIEERISLFVGTLNINSSPGKGTTLRIVFPSIELRHI
ncbi:MAG: PAS domain-containing sensor histidine kinase [Ardenticatenaceae bacterium]|nr:PAS domain-containing sensor histidine kinase [Ardenticatenaceae bacterium]